MDKIFVDLKSIVNLGVAAAVIDLIYFGMGIVPSMEFGGELWHPSSWTVGYFIAPPDAKMALREITLLALTIVAIGIYGWKCALIEDNV